LVNRISSENPTQKPHCQQVLAEGFVLTPELKGFIERTLVPLLVQRYIEKMKKKAKDEAALSMPPTTLPPAQ